MFCNECGKEIPENSVCDCGKAVDQQTQQQQTQADTADNSRIYCILSYIGILWLVGLLVQEKNDPKVRFHVGQGIILSIVNVGLVIVITIVLAILSPILNQSIGWGGLLTVYSPVYTVISNILWIATWAFTIVLMIIGILNAVKGKENKLPVIGKFAFYK